MLTHIHPSFNRFTAWLVMRSSSPYFTRRCVLRWSPLTTAMCREPLCPQTGVTSCGTASCASHQRTLLLLHRSYGLMRQTKTLPLTSVSLISVGLCPAGRDCQPLLGDGPSRHYLCNPCVGAWTPTPRCPPGALARFFPEGNGLTSDVTGSAHQKCSLQCNFNRVFILGAAVIR